MYAIRDGLEVIRQGLASETGNLKKRREEGVPVAVAQTGDGGEKQTEPVLPPQSEYAQVG